MKADCTTCIYYHERLQQTDIPRKIRQRMLASWRAHEKAKGH